MKNSQKSPERATSAVLSNIIFRKPEELHPSPLNARVHHEKQLAILMASIESVGFTVPILVDENSQILAGHGRHQAALRLALSLVPTRTVLGLSEAQKVAYMVGDNKIGELSSWDDELLKKGLQFVDQSELDIAVTGFTTAEIEMIFDDSIQEAPDPDDLTSQDVQPLAITRKGDLWILGEHRIICGDALDPQSYEVLMQGEIADVVVSDVPYNLVISEIGGKGKVKHSEFAMASGEMSPEAFTAFLRGAFTLMHAHSSDGAIHFYFMDWRHMSEIQQAATPIFGPLRQLCVWVKSNGGMGTFYRSRHELVFVYKKGDAKHVNNFELGAHRYRTNVWEYPGVNGFGRGHELLKLHPTVKCTAMIADAIRDCSHRKGIVLDAFAGSGTVLIAAERTHRYARAIELEPRYVDVSIMRWQRVTGHKAILAATGQTWNDLRAQRLAELMLKPNSEISTDPNVGTAAAQCAHVKGASDHGL